MSKKLINVKVISDIHFGKKDDKKLWTELQEQFLPTIDSSLDLLVIAGDLFDRVIKLNESTSHYVFKFIDQLVQLSEIHDFKIRILKGTRSHDYNQLNNFKSYEKSDRFGIAEEVVEEEIFEGVSVLYIPEEYIDNPKEYYKDFFNRKYDLVFFHGTMDFAGFTEHIKDNNSAKQSPTFKSSEIAKLSYGPIVGGHIHIKSNYKKKIYYTGSFSRFNFGEPEDKGFIEYTYNTETKEYCLKYVKNNAAPEYVTINLNDLQGNLEERLEQIEILKEEYTNLRIDISEKDKKENEGVVDAIKRLTDENVKIKVASSFEEQYDSKYEFILQKKLPLSETIQKFIKITKDKDIALDSIVKIIEKPTDEE